MVIKHCTSIHFRTSQLLPNHLQTQTSAQSALKAMFTKWLCLVFNALGQSHFGFSSPKPL